MHQVCSCVLLVPRAQLGTLPIDWQLVIQGVGICDKDTRGLAPALVAQHKLHSLMLFGFFACCMLVARNQCQVSAFVLALCHDVDLQVHSLKFCFACPGTGLVLHRVLSFGGMHR